MTRTRRTLIGALVLGLLSGPAIAIATSGFGSNTTGAASTVPPATSMVATTVTAAAAGATDEDTAAACGFDGLALVAQEQAGTIDAVGQAALDALRPICAAEGLPLPAASSVSSPPPTIVETVTIPAPQSATAAPAYGEYEDDEYEGYEDEHEEDEEDEEDEEHEEDD